MEIFETTRTNAEYLQLLCDLYPNFKDRTAKLTADVFSESGMEAVINQDPTYYDELWNLSQRLFLNRITGEKAVDRFAESGFGEDIYEEYGGAMQRILVMDHKPINPKWKNLRVGESVDQQTYRPARMKELIWKQFVDYADCISIPYGKLMKPYFLSENGISQLEAQYRESIQNSYTRFMHNTHLEQLDHMLTPDGFTLKPTQKVHVKLSPRPLQDEMEDELITLLNVIEAMTQLGASCGKFNAMGRQTVQNVDDLFLLIRGGWRAERKVRMLANTFNKSDLAIPLEHIMVVENFGGLKPYKEKGLTTPLFVMYDQKTGEQLGYNETNHPEGLHATAWGPDGFPTAYADASGSPVTLIDEDEVFWKDPHEKTTMVLADRHCIFTRRTNPFSVDPAPVNAAGMYQSLWPKCLGIQYGVAYEYNFVEFVNDGAPKATAVTTKAPAPKKTTTATK